MFTVRLGGQVIPERAVRSLLNLVYLAFVVNFFPPAAGGDSPFGRPVEGPDAREALRTD